MRMLVIFMCMAACSKCSGQSSFDFRNRFPELGFFAPILDSNEVPLEGTNYLAELYGGATAASLTPALQGLVGNSRLILPFNRLGYIAAALAEPSSEVIVRSVPPYSYAWLQVRAWDARLGGTYEEVMGLGIGGYGESPIFYQQGNNPLRIPPELPAPLIGLQSFSLRPVVPEPGTWVLLALGGLGILTAARRRK